MTSASVYHKGVTSIYRTSCIEVDIIQETEQVGIKEVEYVEQERFLFFFNRNVTKIKSQPIYEDIQYQVLAVPSSDQLRRGWTGGVEACDEILWSKLADWIFDYFRVITGKFENAVDMIKELVDDSLKEQLEIIQGDFEAAQKIWDQIELQKNASFVVFNKIEEAFTLVKNGEK